VSYATRRTSPLAANGEDGFRLAHRRMTNGQWRDASPRRAHAMSSRLVLPTGEDDGASKSAPRRHGWASQLRRRCGDRRATRSRERATRDRTDAFGQVPLHIHAGGRHAEDDHGAKLPFARRSDAGTRPGMRAGAAREIEVARSKRVTFVVRAGRCGRNHLLDSYVDRFRQPRSDCDDRERDGGGRNAGSSGFLLRSIPGRAESSSPMNTDKCRRGVVRAVVCTACPVHPHVARAMTSDAPPRRAG